MSEHGHNPWKNEMMTNKTQERFSENEAQRSDREMKALNEEIRNIEQFEEKLETEDVNILTREELQREIEELKEKLAESHDQMLRAHAEIQNIRHRASKDIENAHKYALEKFVKELLLVVDSLEKALENKPSPETKSLYEGVVLTHRILLDGFKRIGVEVIDPLHQPFDPKLHEAVSLQENPEMVSNTIMVVLQKGYQLNHRLIRPARVVVSK